MGGQTSVQLLQWKGREFPNEESITGLEFFELTTKMEDIDLKNMIRRDYGYCICRQIIYKKDGYLIQNKYFPQRNNEKMNWIYIGILKDTNCRCSFWEIKKLVEKGNNDTNKLKSNVSNLEGKLNNVEKKTNEIKVQLNQNQS